MFLQTRSLVPSTHLSHTKFWLPATSFLRPRSSGPQSLPPPQTQKSGHQLPSTLKARNLSPNPHPHSLRLESGTPASSHSHSGWTQWKDARGLGTRTPMNLHQHLLSPACCSKSMSTANVVRRSQTWQLHEVWLETPGPASPLLGASLPVEFFVVTCESPLVAFIRRKAQIALG